AGEPGLFFHIEGGRILACEEREAVPGTRMLVEDLFYNTPARKHFQKSPVSEGIFINELVGRYALARPDISISFSNEGRLYYKTPGNGQLRDAIIAVHGSSLMEQLLPLSYEGENISLSGYISRPELKKSNRKLQCFYIN
ncbi:MAG TPA: DNA mismatch repair protein MutL, partial [Syntrophomonas sp.]|nr:DNA mismatch repair protein MutL [Syntrophomonas sp.]